MITLKLSEKQLDDLYDEILSNANPRARMKCLIVYLRAKGRPCHEIADIARVDGDTLTHAVKKYSQGGLAGLLKQGKRTVVFVDAAHFVMGAFLGMVWRFTRLLLPSASGRKSHNVLGAYGPITPDVFCAHP